MRSYSSYTEVKCGYAGSQRGGVEEKAYIWKDR